MDWTEQVPLGRFQGPVERGVGLSVCGPPAWPRPWTSSSGARQREPASLALVVDLQRLFPVSLSLCCMFSAPVWLFPHVTEDAWDLRRCR